ncbi:trypsin-like peptidase domain-containing protein [Marinovum sp.]|uniref:trypsin-like peptidase domain-containing protein n=1 Tax=Marinovum sp. TaxID=2024839 RepID=UPI002B2758F1|nr:trypsin-like peptidase domain-containing protein [Marinovum sp.]
MTRLFFATVFALVSSLSAVSAQDNRAWIQVEALPSLLEAEERVRDYAEYLPNVNGFAVGSGWYAVALGPYPSRNAATGELRQLRGQGRVPRDSFVVGARALQRQFWPVGADAQTPPAEVETSELAEALEAIGATEASDSTEAAADGPETTPAVPEETVAEARRSEAQMTGQEKRDLQVALQWAGFYNAAIDGAYGAGTRRAMAAWQEANEVEATGVMTTRQRALAMQQYNAVLEGMGLQRVTDSQAGIEMVVPLGVVEFEAHEAPFARYEPTGDLPARVLLISQEGDQRRLYGLYDILQTLEAVPLDGPRERRNDGFSITGSNSRIVSHTEVSLRDGEIKGFMLVWPAGDEDRRTRVLQEMSDSFTRVPGVLPSDIGVGDTQSVDLLSGLQIRKPRVSRTGFFVSEDGTVLTTLEAVEGCTRVTLDGKTEASVSATDATLGVALLTPQTRLAPLEVAELATAAPRLQSEIAVAGFSYEGVLGAPSMTFGKLVDLRGLDGEEALDRVSLSALPGDAGGPVMNSSGAVIGMLLPRDGADRTLPEEVSFSADAGALQTAMRQAGVTARMARGGAALAPEDLTNKARGMAVLVSCWE